MNLLYKLFCFLQFAFLNNHQQVLLLHFFPASTTKPKHYIKNDQNDFQCIQLIKNHQIHDSKLLLLQKTSLYHLFHKAKQLFQFQNLFYKKNQNRQQLNLVLHQAHFYDLIRRHKK